MLDRLITGEAKGFYVEVGALHPFRFSNTFLFYRRGWNGICIDPLPGIQSAFEKWRPRDVFVETAISEKPSPMTYFMFNEPALNTFDPLIAKQRDGLGHYKITETKTVSTNTLASVLDSHLPPGQEITFLSVDVEGLDLEVLKSNDWSKYRPKFLVAECLETDLVNLSGDAVVSFLRETGYTPYAKTGNSIIFCPRPC